MKQILILLTIICSTSHSYSQLFGGSLILNPQTESIGIEIRGVLPFRRIQVSPQIAYFPFFNKVSEVYAGISLQGVAYYNSRIQIYGLANASYNYWANYADSPLKDAKASNFSGEVGLGIAGQRCISPFAEFRYNAIFRETNVRVGILFDLTCGGAAGYHAGSQGAVKCTPCK